ncbi:MAG TPA: ATP-binding protein, partial [bacterium]|nr:ATP-binding protein [bacterium]
MKSIQGKMVVLYILLVLVAMEIIGVQLVQRLQNYYDQNFRTTLETQANLLAGFATRYFAGEQSEAYLGDLVDDFRLQTGAQITVVDAGGMLLAASGAQQDQLGKRLQQPHIIRALSGVSATEVRRESQGKARTLYLAVPVRRHGEVVGSVGLSSSLDEVDRTLSEIKGIFLKATATALLATAALGFALARTITKPIQEVTNQAQAIADGDFDEPVTVYSQDEVGQLAAMFNHLRERLKANLTALSQEKEKVEAVLANLSDGVVALDSAGTILLINPAALRLLPLTHDASQIVGRDFAAVFPQLDLEITTSPTPTASTVELVDKYQQKRVLRVHMATFKTDPAGPGLVITLQDITDEERLEAMRREFVANVSHELRTPLTAAKSYVETILDEDETLEPGLRRRFLTVVNDEVDRMVRLIRDLLQLAQLDAGRAPLKKQPLSLPDLARKVMERFQVQARHHQLTLDFQAPDPLPPVVADRDRLDQVLANLIGNAVKYSPPRGKIQITITAETGAGVKTTVSDSGPGIPTSDQGRIFERFYRVDKARSRAQGGTGLGLSIAKQIIEAHGGTIQLASVVDEGTAVSFTLPAGSE